MGNVFACEVLDLLGLLVDDTGSIGKVVVDELLVGLVDERAKEEDRGGDKSESPDGYKFDKIVGQECSNESLALLACFMTQKNTATYGAREEHILDK